MQEEIDAEEEEWIAETTMRQKEYEIRQIFNLTERIQFGSGPAGLTLEAFLDASKQEQLVIINLYHSNQELVGTVEEIQGMCSSIV